MIREKERFLVRDASGKRQTAVEYETYEHTGTHQDPSAITVIRRSHRILNGDALEKLPDGSFKEEGTSRVYHRI